MNASTWKATFDAVNFGVITVMEGEHPGGKVKITIARLDPLTKNLAEAGLVLEMGNDPEIRRRMDDLRNATLTPMLEKIQGVPRNEGETFFRWWVRAMKLKNGLSLEDGPDHVPVGLVHQIQADDYLLWWVNFLANQARRDRSLPLEG